MLIDTHAHLDFASFDADREAVIERARQAGVEKIVNITSYAKDFDKVKQIAASHDNIWHAAGIHPHDTAQLKDPKWLARVKTLAIGPKAVAIGEIGLDYFKMPPLPAEPRQRRGENTKEEQKQLFQSQLTIAQELKLPVILHIRDAYDDVYEMVKSLKLRGVVHCYSGTVEWAKRFLELGFMISFTGIITFPKTAILSEVIKAVPLERIMVETDCPFLAPQRIRGQRCEPAYVKDVAEKIAEIKGISFEDVTRATTKNAEKFFNV